jgi:hypothetical protein
MPMIWTLLQRKYQYFDFLQGLGHQAMQLLAPVPEPELWLRLFMFELCIAF